MRKLSRESLEFKYLIFVIALLIGGFLWSGIISFSAISLEKIYGRSFHSIMWTSIISIIGVTAVAFLFWIIARKLVIKPLQSIEKAEKRGGSIETIVREDTDGKDREAEGGEAGDRGEERAEGIRPYGRGEVPGGALGLDGKTETRGGMPGVGGCVELAEPVAGAGDGGNALGLAATDSDDGEDSSFELASCGIIGAEEQREAG